MPQITVQLTLSEEQFSFVERQMATGEFSSESELVATGLRRLSEDVALEAWLSEVAAPSSEDYPTDSDSASPLNHMTAKLNAGLPESEQTGEASARRSWERTVLLPRLSPQEQDHESDLTLDEVLAHLNDQRQRAFKAS